MRKRGNNSVLYNVLLTLLLLIVSTACALSLFNLISTNTANVSLIYILALILTALLTDGYWYGIMFSVVSIVLINFLFTFPYFVVNFTLTDYPITFIVMLTITLITSATTSHTKIQAKQLAEHEENLSKAEKEKMRANLLRAISHDLRTPLTSIIGESDAYFDISGDDAVVRKEDIVHRINDDAHWLLHMVENLLTVTRIQDGVAARVSKTPEVVEEVVSEAVFRFKRRQPEAKVQIKIPPDYIMLPMDPLLIEQVIVNLLDNAYVHSGTKSAIELTVTENGSSVTFHVRDYGKCISPTLLPTIFDGIGDRSVANSDTYKGMGIGLSICKTIIESHEGSIIAMNHPDGAEFDFTLPKSEHLS